MKRNNRGFTLLELIISFAILAILVLVVMGFMTAGAGTYRSVSTESTLQYNSQLTLSQMQSSIINCNGGACFDTGTETLYLLNRDEAGNYTLLSFQRKDDKLYYNSQSVTVGPDGKTLSYYTTEDSASYQPDYMADGVGGFTVTFETAYDAETKMTYAVRTAASLTLENGGRTFTGTQETALRNSVITAGDLSTMLKLAILGTAE